MYIALMSCPVYCTCGLVEFVNAAASKWFNKTEKRSKKRQGYL